MALPLCNTDGGAGAPALSELGCVLTNIIQALLATGGFAAAVFIIKSAITLATTQGDPKAIGKAKAELTWAIIGFLITVGAIAIIRLAGNLIGYNLLPSTITIDTNLY